MTNGTKLCIIVARTEHDWLHLECFGKINTQSNNQSQKFGAKNKYTEKLNFLFFSFHFTFYVYTFRRMLAIGILCIPVYGVCCVCLRCQCSWVADSMTECSQSKSKKKTVPSQPHTQSKKENERERERMLNNTIKIAKWKKGERKQERTPRTIEFLLKIDTISMCVCMKRQQQMKEKENKSKWNKLPKMKTTRASKIYLYKTFSFLFFFIFAVGNIFRYVCGVCV